MVRIIVSITISIKFVSLILIWTIHMCDKSFSRKLIICTSLYWEIQFSYVQFNIIDNNEYVKNFSILIGWELWNFEENAEEREWNSVQKKGINTVYISWPFYHFDRLIIIYRPGSRGIWRNITWSDDIFRGALPRGKYHHWG